MNQHEQKQWKNLLLTVTAVTAVICIIILFFFKNEIFRAGLNRCISILQPFIYGAVIAYLLRPVCLFFEKWLTRAAGRLLKKQFPATVRMISILLSLALLIGAVLMLLMTVLPETIRSISGIISAMPDAIARYQAWITSLDHGSSSHEIVTALNQAADTLSEQLQHFLQTSVLPNLETLISRITSSFMDLVDLLKNFGLGCIISSYLLGGWEKFSAQGKLIVYALFPEKIADWIKKEIRYADRMFSGFIHGKVLDSLIVGVICFLFMLVTSMPYAVLIGVIVGVTNMIPFFGPYLGAIPSALLVLTVSPARCIIFLIFIIILQQIDGNILGPYILGDRLGISSFWILFAILFFGSLWGLPGMLVGVPLFAVLYDLIRSFVLFCLHKRRRTDLIHDYRQREN